MDEIKVGIIDHDYRYPYGEIDTYVAGAQWLAGCSQVEDWGCGRGYFKVAWEDHVAGPGRYIGIDVGVDSVPTHNPFADVTADLTTYRSETPGLFMRHVLEHNYEWRDILGNAVASFTDRMFLAIFTPWSTTPGVEEVLTTHGPPEYPFYDPPQPNLAFDPPQIERFFDGMTWTRETLFTGTQYGLEHVFRVVKP